MLLRLALLFSIVMVLFDVVMASFAKAASIDYSQFVLLSVFLYVGAGILAGRKIRNWFALLSIVIAAVVEAVLGGYLAALIGPGAQAPGMSDAYYYGTAVFAVLLNVILGAIGVAVGIRVGRSQRRAT
jgi:hypothetical protein